MAALGWSEAKDILIRIAERVAARNPFILASFGGCQIGRPVVAAATLSRHRERTAF